MDSKSFLNKERLESTLKSTKEEYGDDFTITYKVDNKTKLEDKSLEELNKDMNSKYNSKDKASECYELSGTIYFKGSKKSESNKLYLNGYCKYNDTWYLVSY